MCYLLKALDKLPDRRVIQRRDKEQPESRAHDVHAANQNQGGTDRGFGSDYYREYA